MALQITTCTTFIALAVFCVPVAAGQPPSLDWTLQMENHWISAITVDKIGNIVATGCWFSPDPDDWFPGSSFFPWGEADKCSEIFVTKLSASGEEVWTYRKESLGHDRAFEVAVNDLGDVFIAGQTKGNLTGTAAKESSGIFDCDLFVMCVLANGQHSWTYQYHQVGMFISPSGIALDEAGDVLITGFTDPPQASLPGSAGSGPS